MRTIEITNIIKEEIVHACFIRRLTRNA